MVAGQGGKYKRRNVKLTTVEEKKKKWLVLQLTLLDDIRN